MSDYVLASQKEDAIAAAAVAFPRLKLVRLEDDWTDCACASR
jgi:hypothetical protein